MFRLIGYLRHYKKESVIGPLFKMLEAFFELIVPLIMARIIDIGVKNQDTGYILTMAGVLILLGILGLLCSVTAQYFAARAAFGFGLELRRDMFAHINRLSFPELDKIGTPTLITRVTNDITLAQTGVNLVLRLFLRSPFIVAGALIMSFTINVRIALIFLAAVPLLSMVIYGNMLLNIPIFRRVQQQLDKLARLTRENLSGVRVIRAFSQQKTEIKQFHECTEELKAHQTRAGRITALLNPITYVIVNLAIILIVWQGGKTVDTGIITQGEVIALVNYMSQILLALIALAELIMSFTKAQASAGRICAVFDIQPSLSDEDCTDPDTESDTAVAFENVSFVYGESKEEALSDITFTAKKGETIGIIGGTGSGKTTLINLIPRFYDASSGRVLINGTDVRRYPFPTLRKIISVVPQKAVLFRGTIRENMCWGKADADDAEIIEALKIAQAYDFVMEKPDGLDEMIHQGGKNLSGGQRQRLTIARALVAKPEILILDDSASALDFATDAKLRKALGTLSGQMTVFIVSQRASSLKHADKILVLEDGCTVGIGTHEELMNSCEVYREICLSQLSQKEAGRK